MKIGAGEILALIFFFMAGVFGAEMILARLSYLKAGDFETGACSSTIQIDRNGIHTGKKGNCEITYKGVSGFNQRPLHIRFMVRFTSLDNLEIFFDGPDGQSAKAGKISPTDLWQHAIKIRRNKPVALQFFVDSEAVNSYIESDIRDRLPAPSWPISKIRFVLQNTGFEILAADIFQRDFMDKPGEQLYASGNYLPDKKWLFAPVYFSFFLAALLLLWVNRLTNKRFTPFSSGNDSLALIFTGFCFFWAISWVPVSLGMALCLVVAIPLLKISSILTLRVEQKILSPNRSVYLVLLLQLAFTFLVTWITLSRSGITSVFLVFLIVLVALFALYLFARLFSRAWEISFKEGLSADAILHIPLIPFGIAAIFFVQDSGVLFILVGWILVLSNRLAFTNTFRKRIPYSQIYLIALTVALVLVVEGALSFSSNKGPIPKFGSLLNVDTQWRPDELFKDEFPTDPADGSRIFQGQDLDYEKPSSEYRIVFLGGSTTYGDLDNPDFNFVTQITQRLKTDFPDKNIRVFNCGFLGYGSFQMMLLYEKYIQKADVDLVVMYTLNNDMYQPGIHTYREIWKMESTGHPGMVVRLRNFLNRSTLYQAAVAFGHVFVQKRTFAPSGKIIRDFETNIGQIVSGAKAQGSQSLLIPELLNPDLVNPDQEKLSAALMEILRKVSSEYSTAFVDSEKVVLRNTFFTDNVHLNAKGNALVADLIYPSVKEEVETVDK